MRRVVLLSTLALLGTVTAHAQAPRTHAASAVKAAPGTSAPATSPGLFSPAFAADVVLTNLLNDDALTNYTVDEVLPIDSGAIGGTNVYQDFAKASALRLPAGQTTGQVKSVDIIFFYKSPNITTQTYKVAIYNGTPTSGPTGAPVFEATYPLSGAKAATAYPVTTVEPTTHTFAQPVTVGATFFAVVNFGAYPRAEGGRVAIATSRVRGRRLETAWELWSDNSWHNVSDAWFVTQSSPTVGTNGVDLAIFATVSVATAGERDARPGALALGAAHPNPAGAAAAFTYTLPESGPARLAVYDALGREVAVLAAGAQAAGSHTARFEAAGLPAGVYVARLEAKGGVRTRLVTISR